MLREIRLVFRDVVGGDKDPESSEFTEEDRREVVYGALDHLDNQVAESKESQDGFGMFVDKVLEFLGDNPDLVGFVLDFTVGDKLLNANDYAETIKVMGEALSAKLDTHLDAMRGWQNTGSREVMMKNLRELREENSELLEEMLKLVPDQYKDYVQSSIDMADAAWDISPDAIVEMENIEDASPRMINFFIRNEFDDFRFRDIDKGNLPPIVNVARRLALINYSMTQMASMRRFSSLLPVAADFVEGKKTAGALATAAIKAFKSDQDEEA